MFPHCFYLQFVKRILNLHKYQHWYYPKYHFLLEAPRKDPDGRPAVIRFSRKTREQYVQTEVDGKPTGWRFAKETLKGKKDSLARLRITSITAAGAKLFPWLLEVAERGLD